MKDPTARLKRLVTKGEYGPEFIESAKHDLPLVLGRLSLLEEFYSLNAPGIDERSRNLYGQLGTPLRFHGSPIRKLIAAIIG